jgi:hypothetical protein
MRHPATSWVDGQFAEVQTSGIEGIEKDLWLGTLRSTAKTHAIRRKNFGVGFRLGMRLDVVTTTEIATQSSADYLDESDTATDHRQCRLQYPPDIECGIASTVPLLAQLVEKRRLCLLPLRGGKNRKIFS